MPDKSRGVIYGELVKNGQRRKRAECELELARSDLGQLLVRGQAAGLTVTEMADAARVSRETAHKLLRETRELLLQEDTDA